MSNISWAKILRFYFYRKAFFRSAVFCVIQSRHFHFFAKDCCHFSCHTENALAIRSVCCNTDVKHVIIKTGDCFHICTGFCILGHYKQTIVACTRIHILVQTKLCAGTKHTLGFITSQFTFFNRHHTFDGDMVFGCCVNLCTNQSNRVFSACMYVISTTTDL